MNYKIKTLGNVMAVEMPPLRERKEDINALAKTFIRKFSGELRKKMTGLEPAAEKLLQRYSWPGNIRELENAIERAVLLAEGGPAARRAVAHHRWIGRNRGGQDSTDRHYARGGRASGGGRGTDDVQLGNRIAPPTSPDGPALVGRCGGGARAAGAGLSGVIEERRWNRRFLPEAPRRASDALAR